MKLHLIALAALALPAAAQVIPPDPCVGTYGFARDDCLAEKQRAAQEKERLILQQQQLQQQLLVEQIRTQQLQNEALRRKLEAEAPPPK